LLAESRRQRKPFFDVDSLIQARCTARKGPSTTLAFGLPRRSLVAVVAILATQCVLADRATPAQTLGAGAWSWFSDPRAVHHRGIHHRTYTAWIEPNGDEVVASWDGKQLVRAVVGRQTPTNDHGNPVLQVLPDGRLAMFSSHHNGRRLRLRISSRAEDVTAWGPVRPVGTNTLGTRGYTYPNPINLAGEGNRLYLFWRGADWQPAYSWSEGNGPWAPARRLLQVGSAGSRFLRPYVKYASDGHRKIAFAFSDGHPRNRDTSLWFAFYRRGAFYRADGRRIGRLGRPLRGHRADRVHNGPKAGRRVWVHDVALTPRGRPVIVYATFSSRYRHRYAYAIWERRRWRRRKIVEAGGPIGSGERYYSGGIALDHADPSVVYLSREVRGIHQLERWRTANGGRSWRRQRLTGSRDDNVRPVVPRGLHLGEREVLWMHGRYEGYRHFDTSILQLSW
jgi:hypothetical protein